eukprot:2983876-Pyramimonas_sp.AAC.1
MPSCTLNAELSANKNKTLHCLALGIGSARGCTDAAARLLPRPSLLLLAAPAHSAWNSSTS